MAEGAVLLLVNERGDRRLLWELLDGEEFEAIYAAKDVAQARSMRVTSPSHRPIANERV